MQDLLFGLGVAGMGMLVVFIGLIILIGFIKLLGMVINTTSKKKSTTPMEAKEPVQEVSAQPACETSVSDDVSPEIVAAIVAAIASVWDGETGFRVRRVRRINNAPAWNRAGREEQIYGRF